MRLFHQWPANHAMSFRPRTKTWKASFTKQVKIKEMAKMENDRRAKLTRDQIVQFEKSKVVRETVKFLVYCKRRTLK